MSQGVRSEELGVELATSDNHGLRVFKAIALPNVAVLHYHSLTI